MRSKERFNQLATEARNPRTRRLDIVPTSRLVELINLEDHNVAKAVKRSLPQVTRAVEMISKQMAAGGRLIYVGAGTSGRIGILDAVECVPTFNTDPEQIQGMIAGGFEGCYRAVEANEDDADAGARDLLKKAVSAQDVVVGIAASGRTPYTCGALRFAKSMGAKTIAIVNNPGTEMKRIADLTIEALTGPEALTGSTRMKAGTAQKMICNILTTAALVRLGAAYSNLMINVHMKNEKLLNRGLTILREITGVGEQEARKALSSARGNLKVAAVMLGRKCNATLARSILNREKGNLRKALEKTTRTEK
ncbi:MAG: N-acetylmuramic acid 6-phosphate etherase [Acidobacteriia bacterium]|nr:N-acetylmuramic acid 6-phosphate etherase [Terriglobia bacterium]